MKTERFFPRELYDNRYMLLELTLRDFKSRYAGSMLGLVWAFLQPLAMMAILWFVFTFGLKSGTVEKGTSFVVWFFPASIAWNFFQDGVVVTSNAITDYAFLVRKIDFRVRLLPMVKILSALILHAIFFVIMAVILIASGYPPTVHWFDALYYMFCTGALLLGVGWMLAAMSVFAKDVGQLVSILMQFGFWLTPIIWNWRSLPERFQGLVWLNPVFYITEGYRDAFVHGVSIVEHGRLPALYFWGFTLAMLAIGGTVFKRLRPHFADVL